MKNQSVISNIDWIIVLSYIALVVLGWLNIYSSSLPEVETSIFDFSQSYGKQLIFIIISVPLIFVLLTLDAKFYEKFSIIIFGVALLAIAGLFVFGKTVKGQANWYSFGSFGLQPSEFAKFATALALSKYLSDVQVNLKDVRRQLQALGIIFLPVILIVPHDPGSALIYTVFFFVLYREGLPSWYLWAGFVAIIIFIAGLLIEVQYIILIAFIIIALSYFRTRLVDRNIIFSSILFVVVCGFTLSTNYLFENVLQQHHRDRFNILLGREVDLKGIGYNVNQSKIAIGSGGWYGKGFLEGTQTKGGFVPEQHTDYIFTTVGEEWGFIGSLVVILIFLGLILRILYSAERQKTKFSRVYGYCVASIFFIHFFVNTAMVVGIFPTIGVPLPLFSYGGSGILGFTILLFIFVKMDANKVNEW
ncbi:MAG TPA: rod shape-determining protein RodA [Flavobacterium sp.]|jgi:rod shape determining protein RodA